MIKAAIVGLGRWGQTLVNAVQGSSDKIQFATAVSRDPSRVRDFVDKHDLKTVTSLTAVLDDPTIDAVVLATPHSQHLDEVLATAAAGKAVFCEKPLTLTRAEAVRAVAACREAGVLLGVGTDKRFFPAMAEIARIAECGELGQLLHLEGNFSNEVSSMFFSPWREDPAESPAGGMTGTGIHVLDSMIRIAGPVRRVRAQLQVQKPAPDPLDTIATLLEFRSGMSGTLAAVRCTPLFLRLHVFGRDGSAEIIGRNELILRRSRGEAEHRKFPANDSVRINLEAFADALTGTAAYPITPEHMIEVVAAFEAIAQSAAAEGEAVSF